MTLVTQFGTPSAAWAWIVGDLLGGDTLRTSPRGRPTREAPHRVHFEILHPNVMPLAAAGREFRSVIGAAEGLSLVGQTSIPEVIVDKVAAFRPFMRDSVFWGAYGPRAAGDVGQVVDLLRRDPDSRQAVITLFDSDRDLGRVEQVDLPCTVAVQFLLRDEYFGPERGDVRKALGMWVAMRSNDAWLGLPYDLMQFTMLQAAVAQALGAVMGPYTHTAGSMHLYEQHVGRAAEVSAAEPDWVFPWPWWGGSGDIGETASRARRILTGHGVVEHLTKPTAFELWLLGVMA